MSEPVLVLFDDDVARAWRPFTLTRPAGELLFGAQTLRRRAEIALGLECIGHITDPALADYDESWAAPVLSDAPPHDRDRVLLRSRFVAEPADLPDGSVTLVCDGQVVGVRLAAGAATPDPGFFLDPDAYPPPHPAHELNGRILEHVWTLMTGNAERLDRDLRGLRRSSLPDHVYRMGDAAISLGRGVKIAPGVVLDAREGPIRIDDNVEVLPFTYVVGPSWVGPGSRVLGGTVDKVSVGPCCKVRGELETSVLLGYSNKAHNGFLGHAYLGMWVNLGAITTNSDLKNNYGPVRLWTPAGEMDTGETKLGCFLGDHVKTAIGTMLTTGAVVEAGSNLFGETPSTYVPPFSWGDGRNAYDLQRFLETARIAMARRDVRLTDRQASLLSAAWDATRGRASRPWRSG